MIKTKDIVISVALLIVLGFVVYGNSLCGEFLYDDILLVRDNIHIKDWTQIGSIFTKSIGSGYFAGKLVSYRPLQMFTYMIDYSLYGLDVRGYHLTNTLIHILVALAVYWFINILYKKNILSLLASLLFLVHPIHTEAVSYISGRADPLAALFMLLCFIFYIKCIRLNKIIISS